LKLHRTSGTPGPSGPSPSPDSAKPSSDAKGAAPARGPTPPAESVYTQARSASPSASGSVPSPLHSTRADSGSPLRSRPQQRAHELARGLETAPPDVKGAELSRVHGEAALRRAQRLLGPIASQLATALAPAPRADMEAPSVHSLSEPLRVSLQTASTLALDSLRLEDLQGERLTAPQAARVLFQLDLCLLGRRLDEGYSELRAAGQRALAALRP
jgi:hypothetical protein